MIYDFVSIIHQIQKPLFFRPFKKDFIFDILFNRVKIYFALSLDALIEFYNDYGVKAEWASEKATMQLKQQQKNMNTFELNKRGIIITPPNGEQIWLGKGTIAKIIYEHYLPSYMIYCNTINTV